MKILVINAGSSSLKYQLFSMETNEVLAKGLCERIGIDGKVKHTTTSDYTEDVALPDHAAAIRKVTELLTSDTVGVIKSMSEIQAVGHRVVHGGEFFNKSVLIDEKVLKAIEECVPLAPLHNPPNLVGIRACQEVMQNVPQVAVFDTAFHQTMPAKAFLYALPYKYYENYKVRRYGFHGTSHNYVSKKAAEMLGKPIDQLKIITCHLGNGSSITAIDCGKSVDTSMGFTPLAGVPMGTRSGDIDPAIVEFLANKESMTVDAVVNVLNKNSGMLGVSGGISSDFRDLQAAIDNGDKKAKDAYEIFAYSVKKYIGAYAAAMNGCDVLIFTAGVGENNAVMREMIASGLDFMGLKLDKEKNAGKKDIIVSTADSANKIMVIPTNEEFVIANDTSNIVQ